MLAFLDAHRRRVGRRCVEGHLTGSALVVDSVGARTLLMLHRKLGRWFQPGGHADGDANLAHVALREATEETGLADLRVAVPAIDLDIHRVDPPGEPPHLHLDVRFLVIAPDGAVEVANEESLALALGHRGRPRRSRRRPEHASPRAPRPRRAPSRDRPTANVLRTVPNWTLRTSSRSGQLTSPGASQAGMSLMSAKFVIARSTESPALFTSSSSLGPRVARSRRV